MGKRRVVESDSDNDDAPANMINITPEKSQIQNQEPSSIPSAIGSTRPTLSKITLKSFKCYENQDIYPIHPHISYVVGSNGSGKSALIDAILFCLGARSSHIRGKNTDDLIQGDTGRVQLEFSNGLSIGREVIRGDGGHYLLRNARCSREQIHQELLNIGIDINHTERFVLMQSKTVGSFCGDNMKMLNFLEESFGNADLAAHIEKLTSERNTALESLTALETGIQNVEGQIAALGPQVQEYTECQTLNSSITSRKRALANQKQELLQWIITLRQKDLEMAMITTNKAKNKRVQCTDELSQQQAVVNDALVDLKTVQKQAKQQADEWQKLSNEYARAIAQARRHRDHKNRKRREAAASTRRMQDEPQVDIKALIAASWRLIEISLADIDRLVAQEQREEEEGVEDKEFQHISRLEAHVARIRAVPTPTSTPSFKSGDPEFLGMLIDLGDIKPEHALAVESVIGRERLKRTAVVKTRAAGMRVIQQFREQRLGRTTCLILDELPATRTRDITLYPLIHSVSCDAQVRPAFNRYLKDWYLLTDRDEAFAKNHSLNCVTTAGERFFSNGEIVMPPNSQRMNHQPSESNDKILQELSNARDQQRVSRQAREQRRRQLKILHAQVAQAKRELSAHEAAQTKLQGTMARTSTVNLSHEQAQRLSEEHMKAAKQEEDKEKVQRARASDIKKSMNTIQSGMCEVDKQVAMKQTIYDDARDMQAEYEEKEAAIKSTVERANQEQKRARAALRHAERECDRSIEPSSSTWRQNLSESQARSKMAVDMSELQAQQRHLDDRLAAIDTSVVTVHARLGQDKKHLEDQHSETARLLEQTENELDSTGQRRFMQFKDKIALLNSQLRSTYQHISCNGDCYLSHPQSYSALFDGAGVTFHIKPDRTTWRLFSELSGGQQALAALSLHLALHRITPCPLYLFDEIDASLDIASVTRVHEFLAKSPGQYITCTLREQAWDLAPSLIGVYKRNGVARVVVKSFE